MMPSATATCPVLVSGRCTILNDLSLHVNIISALRCLLAQARSGLFML